MDKKLVPLSRFLSFVLRHEPEAIGIALDANGWVDVAELLEACARTGRQMSRAQLLEVVETNDKQRFALSEDGARIRASQGHSVPVDLDLVPEAPPALLYHGTVEKFLAGIRDEGLKKGSRHDVHLSVDEATATQVGERRGKPVILVIDAARMHTDGFTFTVSANGVWLTAEVPVEYIEFPDDVKTP